MKPVIGITCDIYAAPDGSGLEHKLKLNYCEMVAEAGGIPIIIPTASDVRELAHMLDGILIPGGRDIDPARFGQKQHPEAELQNPARYEVEEVLYRNLPEGAPVLGICYGAQFLNVAEGGTINQHIPDQLANRDHEGGTLQDYAVDPDSKFGSIVDQMVKGKSYHHQAIDEVAGCLKVVARHPDGTIEAVEGAGARWVIGVQWHPERTPEDPNSKRIFASFVGEAKRYRESRL